MWCLAAVVFYRLTFCTFGNSDRRLMVSFPYIAFLAADVDSFSLLLWVRARFLSAFLDIAIAFFSSPSLFFRLWCIWLESADSEDLFRDFGSVPTDDVFRTMSRTRGEMGSRTLKGLCKNMSIITSAIIVRCSVASLGMS